MSGARPIPRFPLPSSTASPFAVLTALPLSVTEELRSVSGLAPVPLPENCAALEVRPALPMVPVARVTKEDPSRLQLGGRFPARMLVPTSGGDAIYGPWKGFRELQALGASGALPRMVAAQAAGCDPIVRGWRAGATTVPVHPDPRTLAVSIADETGGPASLRAIAESGGSAEAVPEEALLGAMRQLARQGIAVEPSSAASVAAALALAARGELASDEDVVCVLTGSGAKWPDALVDALTPRELSDASPDAVRAWIEASEGAVSH